MQPKAARPGTVVPAPCGGNVGRGAVQPKAARPGPAVPAPCGGNVGRSAVQPKAAARAGRSVIQRKKLDGKDIGNLYQMQRQLGSSIGLTERELEMLSQIRTALEKDFLDDEVWSALQRDWHKWAHGTIKQATFLNETSGNLFVGTKSKNSKLMEVQSAIFDGRLFIASNYAMGNDDEDLKSVLSDEYEHQGTTYSKSNKLLSVIAGALHAEQQILNELAKVLANSNKVNPLHVTVIGTKRPCSVCRRVLQAFDHALRLVYPAVHLHFVDQTGADTSVEALTLSETGSDEAYDKFAHTYTEKLKVLMKTTTHLSGEELGNGERTNAKWVDEDIT